MILDFLYSFIATTGWLFLPLFLVGATAWYLYVAIHSRLLNFHNKSASAKHEKTGVFFSFPLFFRLRKSHNYQKMAHYYFKYYLANQNTETGQTDSTKGLHHHLAAAYNKEDFEKFVSDLLRGFHRDARTIAVLAQVAPLLGLLGTVTGMMNTFEVISVYGNNNPILIADGISKAMLTTQIGLLVAFPLILAVGQINMILRVVKTELLKEFVSHFAVK